MAISDSYDRGAKELGKYKYGKPVSQYMKDTKGSNVKRLTGLTGLGFRVGTTGDGKKKSAVYRLAVEKPSMSRSKFDPSKIKHGNGLRMSGGACEMCKGSGMNDKFLFASQAL